MGIHRFFYWFKNTFGEHIQDISSNTDLNTQVDTLLLDLNGIFHTSAQKIYQYGNYKPRPTLMRENVINNKSDGYKQRKVFQDVCYRITQLVNLVQPSTNIVLCVDGTAPLGKQLQQRKRRYKSAQDSMNSNMDFDPCSITPGTRFLDNLTKYIDWYIRKMISQDDTWKHLNIYYSNEKVSGEGEHKILEYIRKYGNENDTYCMYGIDADLIMLSMGTHLPKFYILRDDMYNKRNHLWIDISAVASKLSNEIMCWDNTSSKKYNKKYAINDFIFMCFMVGNDFLPQIPTIDIFNGGIDIMLNLYKTVGYEYGHLTRIVHDKVFFVKKSLEIFLGEMSTMEKDMLETKLNSNDKFHPDEILNNNTLVIENKGYKVDTEKYREEYYSKHFQSHDISTKNVCLEYLKGMQWVLSYYLNGVPDWRWYYPYHYAPFPHDMSKYLHHFKFPEFNSNAQPLSAYEQLLSVLPPKSANLIPHPLNTLLTDTNSVLKKYCPDEVKVDLSGKRQEWEGIVIIPHIDVNIVSDEYTKLAPQIDTRDMKRNTRGYNFLYKYNPKYTKLFKSYYGDIENCSVSMDIV